MIIFNLNCPIYLKTLDKSFKKVKYFSSLNHLTMKKINFAIASFLDNFFFSLSSKPGVKTILFAN